MIVVETLLRDIFSQIPPVSYNGKEYPVKFHWGNQDDLNLYMKTESGNVTPLIWLLQEKTRHKSTEATRNIRLIIAKSSEHKESRNPIVWETEFTEVLDPLCEKVLRCFEMSGLTTILNQEYSIYREANYSEYERDISGKKTSTKTIDHWNVIEFIGDILINDNSNCIQTINFN